MRHLAVDALRGLPGVLPEADRRDLGDALHVVEHVEDRVAEGNIDHRKLAGGQRFPDLRLPDAPRALAPEIVDPEEPALDEIIAQCAASSESRYSAPTSCITMIGHWYNAVVFEGDDGVVVAAARIAADRGLCQLREPVGQVLVGLRVVGRPASAVALRVRLVHGAAVLECAVVGWIGRHTKRKPAEPLNCAAAVAARPSRDENQRRDRHTMSCGAEGAEPAHDGSLLLSYARFTAT